MRRDRAPDDTRLAVESGDRIREEDATRKRRREPVREAEVGVGLRKRGRDAARPRGHDHRSCDVAAAAEDDVGPPAREDTETDGRCRGREPERPQETRAGPPWKAGDAEGVERVAALRNEL